MAWVDAVIVLALLFFIVTAFNAGFIRELISTAATVGGLITAGLLYDDVADALLSGIDNPRTESVLGFLLIFVGITVAGQLLAALVHPAVTILQLGMADQLLGAAFGALKGVIIIEALLILLVTYPRYDSRDYIQDSQFAQLMLDVSTPILTILPDEFEAAVDQFNAGVDPTLKPG
jgi:membrane protein required for colicin V production